MAHTRATTVTIRRTIPPEVLLERKALIGRKIRSKWTDILLMRRGLVVLPVRELLGVLVPLAIVVLLFLVTMQLLTSQAKISPGAFYIS